MEIVRFALLFLLLSLSFFFNRSPQKTLRLQSVRNVTMMSTKLWDFHGTFMGLKGLFPMGDAISKAFVEGKSKQ